MGVQKVAEDQWADQKVQQQSSDSSASANQLEAGPFLLHIAALFSCVDFPIHTAAA